MKEVLVNQIKIGIVFGDKVLAVGRLVLHDGQIHFEYDGTFLKRGLEISPLKCPLHPGIQTFDSSVFEGLPGIFNDSLSDGWGRLLLDRQARMNGILPGELTPLDRLAYVGHIGMGALVYEPEQNRKVIRGELDLNRLATHAADILEGKATDDEVLQELLTLNSSAAGARPKAMISVDDSKRIIYDTHPLRNGFEAWLVKFPSIGDGLDAGAIEYVYALMAVDAGLEMTKTHLFPAQRGAGYFATQRFDRERHRRLHCHSVCGLLHSDFRTLSLDYEDLLALTMILTHDIREVEKMFRLAVFNVLAHNRDDHSKNFSFLMNENGEWRLSPAYDLTFSSRPNGEQSTTVMGEGKNPSLNHLIKLGLEAKLPQSSIDSAIEQTRAALDRWRGLAAEHGVGKANMALIEKRIKSIAE